MKTHQEINKMKDDVNKDIELINEKLLTARNEFEFNSFRDEGIRKVAQYNILLEILK